MIILTLRTDKPEAEISLYDDYTRQAHKTWRAHRQLAETIHKEIGELLRHQQKDWHDINGIVCFQGPGSFTGLRIGLTVGNALAYSLMVPIVAFQGDEWQGTGIEHLLGGNSEKQITPFYGAEAHITVQKK